VGPALRGRRGQPMSGMLLDDLGRVLATPMPRSQALRLIGATLFVAMFPRSARAGVTCQQQICGPGTTDACCVDTNPLVPTSTAAACCNANQHCCKRRWGPVNATVQCCGLTQSCADDINNTIKCVDCPSGQTACGWACLESGQTCLNGTVCPSRKVCGSVCLEPGQTCLKVGGKACPNTQVCGKVCCPTGTSCFAFGVCRKCPTKQICGNECCPPGTTCRHVPSRIAPSGHLCVRTLH
jgi:hypothetical protein